MTVVKALILTGYGLNCDYETDHAFKIAGAAPHRVHINELILSNDTFPKVKLSDYHILVFGGGFSWADDHGAGVVLASKLKYNIGDQINKFIHDGKLVIGICNGFQSLVNLGLLPGFNKNYASRKVALTWNKTGNFTDTWVNLKVDPDSPCVFTQGISNIELPVRHAQGNFFASDEDIEQLIMNKQVVMRYSDKNGTFADGKWPLNPNGSTMDIAGICDPTGRVFGLMPHPEAFNDFTNHPEWTLKKEILKRKGKDVRNIEGDGIKIFRNAVEYVTDAVKKGDLQIQ